jgi:hypothetical protein
VNPTQLEQVAACQEYVLAFEVPVQDLAIVYVLERKAELHKPKGG